MRLRLAIVAVVLQVFALAFMAGEREWILHMGKTVWLRTAPVDPRDVMRGDYVRLDYEISQVKRPLWRDGLADTNRIEKWSRRQHRVYASLNIAGGGCAEIVSLSDQRPAEGLFLRGKSEFAWVNSMQVRYGIEAFFMEQGRAKALEDQRFQGRDGVPLNMEVAIGRSGIGVVKGYRWEPLGITLEFDILNRTNQTGGFPAWQTLITAAKVELKNHGTNELAIVDLPEGRSFALVPDNRWGNAHYHWPGETNALTSPRTENVFILKPGESHRTRLELTQSQWFVVNTLPDARTTGAVALQELTQDWSARFRLEYRPPSVEACAGLPHTKLIYHGRLPSRGFNPVGTVD